MDGRGKAVAAAAVAAAAVAVAYYLWRRQQQEAEAARLEAAGVHTAAPSSAPSSKPPSKSAEKGGNVKKGLKGGKDSEAVGAGGGRGRGRARRDAGSAAAAAEVAAGSGGGAGGATGSLSGVRPASGNDVKAREAADTAPSSGVSGDGQAVPVTVPAAGRDVVTVEDGLAPAVLVYLGRFCPPTVGHLRAVADAVHFINNIGGWQVARVVLAPTHDAAVSKALEPANTLGAATRVELVKEALADLAADPSALPGPPGWWAPDAWGGITVDPTGAAMASAAAASHQELPSTDDMLEALIQSSGTLTTSDKPDGVTSTVFWLAGEARAPGGRLLSMGMHALYAVGEHADGETYVRRFRSACPPSCAHQLHSMVHGGGDLASCSEAVRSAARLGDRQHLIDVAQLPRMAGYIHDKALWMDDRIRAGDDDATEGSSLPSEPATSRSRGLSAATTDSGASHETPRARKKSLIARASDYFRRKPSRSDPASLSLDEGGLQHDGHHAGHDDYSDSGGDAVNASYGEGQYGEGDLATEGTEDGTGTPEDIEKFYTAEDGGTEADQSFDVAENGVWHGSPSPPLRGDADQPRGEHNAAPKTDAVLGTPDRKRRPSMLLRISQALSSRKRASSTDERLDHIDEAATPHTEETSYRMESASEDDASNASPAKAPKEPEATDPVVSVAPAAETVQPAAEAVVEPESEVEPDSGAGVDADADADAATEVETEPSGVADERPPAESTEHGAARTEVAA